MKTKMVTIVVALCVVLGVLEEMRVEAISLKLLWTAFQKLGKCCIKIKCLPPDMCVATKSFKSCKCFQHDSKAQKDIP